MESYLMFEWCKNLKKKEMGKRILYILKFKNQTKHDDKWLKSGDKLEYQWVKNACSILMKRYLE